MTHRDDYLASTQERIDRIAENAEFAANLVDFEPSFETSRQQIEACVTELFPATWSAEVPEFSLTTDASEKFGSTTGHEDGVWAEHVEDLSFDPDEEIYHAQLLGATLRQIAASLTDHDLTSHPTPHFLTTLVNLSRAVTARMGCHLPAKFILDTEQFGLSPFSSYLAAADDESPMTMTFDLRQFAGNITGQIMAQFDADGGSLALVDPDVLRSSLSDDENNQIGQLEASGTDCRDEVNQILASAAHRLTSLNGVA